MSNNQSDDPNDSPSSDAFSRGNSTAFASTGHQHSSTSSASGSPEKNGRSRSAGASSRSSGAESVRPILKKKSSLEDGAEEIFIIAAENGSHDNHLPPARTSSMGSFEQTLPKGQPASILKKNRSFEAAGRPFQMHPVPILKRNSVGSELAISLMNAPTSPSGYSSHMHPILKKSSSEDKSILWGGKYTEVFYPDAYTPQLPKPILKKRMSSDEVSDKPMLEIKPILKKKEVRNDNLESPGPKPIIKSPFSRNGSDESSSPENSRIVTQEEIEADLKNSSDIRDLQTVGTFSTRGMQPRRKSHPVTLEDLRNQHHHHASHHQTQHHVHYHESKPTLELPLGRVAAGPSPSPGRIQSPSKSLMKSDNSAAADYGHPSSPYPAASLSPVSSDASAATRVNGGSSHDNRHQSQNVPFVDEFDKKLKIQSEASFLHD